MSRDLYDAAAERAVLGACLNDPVALAQAVELVGAEDFSQPRHADTFAAMEALGERGDPIDAISVSDQLRRRGAAWDTCSADLTTLLDATDGTGAVRHHAGIVAELAKKRRLAGVGREITDAALNPTTASSTVMADAESRLAAAGGQIDGIRGPVQVGDVLDQAVERALLAKENGGALRGLSTGSVDLDRMLGGMEPGSLVVVGARPSMGKTAFGTGIALHNAKARVPTLFVSAEMAASELGARMLATESKVSTSVQRSGAVTPEQIQRIEGARDAQALLPIEIDDRSSPPIARVRMAATSMQRRRGLGLVVVDYLQLVTGRSDVERRDLEVAEVSRGLKALARDRECVVVALAQLNRGLEHRNDKRPSLADLRESGSIEADADVVLFLYRDEVYNPKTTEPGVAEIIVAKHRNGPTGTVKMAWLATTTRFVDPAWDRLQDVFPGASIDQQELG